MPETKTYTQDQVDEMIKQKAEESFKAGQAKAKTDKDAEARDAEYKRLKEAEAKRIAEAEFNEITTALKADELKDTGLKASAFKRFANEHKETLKGLSGEKLAAKVKEIRESADEDDKDLFFTNPDVSASNSLKGGEKGKEEDSAPKFYPNSTIRIRN